MSLPQSSVGTNSAPIIPDKETLLQQTYLEAFRDNYDSVQRWTRWKEDHEQLQSFLTTVPDKLSHEVVIPFSSKALVKAKLVHTNEILTCIGSSWFVKQSAKQGIEMCGRRIKQSEEMLTKLEGERTLLANRQTLPKLEEAFSNDDTKEIIEEYNEEAEAEWKRQHRLREAEYHHKLAELRKKQVEQPPLQTEEDIFRRLDELELEEELNDELERLHAEYEADYENNDEEEAQSTDDDSEDDDDFEDDDDDNDDDRRVKNKDPRNKESVYNSKVLGHDIRESPKSLETLLKESNFDQNLSYNQKPSITSRTESPICKEAWGENSNVDLQAVRKNRRISFADETPKCSIEKIDLVEQNIYIRFCHSESLQQNASCQKSLSDSSQTEGTPPLYQTPADIFDKYRMQVTNAQPKSILKKSSSFPETMHSSSSQNPLQSSSSFGLQFDDEDDLTVYEQPKRDLSHLPPVLCDVREASATVPEPKAEESSQKRMSHFKAARQRSKK